MVRQANLLINAELKCIQANSGASNGSDPPVTWLGWRLGPKKVHQVRRLVETYDSALVAVEAREADQLFDVVLAVGWSVRCNGGSTQPQWDDGVNLPGVDGGGPFWEADPIR